MKLLLKRIAKTSQEKFRIEKVLKRKGDKLYTNGKGMIVILIVGLIKMSQYFPQPFKSFGGNINVKVDFCNYATKTDLKNVTDGDVDTSSLALKTNLASLKTEVAKLDIDKLAPVKMMWLKKLCMIN